MFSNIHKKTKQNNKSLQNKKSSQKGGFVFDLGSMYYGMINISFIIILFTYASKMSQLNDPSATATLITLASGGTAKPVADIISEIKIFGDGYDIGTITWFPIVGGIIHIIIAFILLYHIIMSGNQVNAYSLTTIIGMGLLCLVNCKSPAEIRAIQGADLFTQLYNIDKLDLPSLGSLGSAAGTGLSFGAYLITNLKPFATIFLYFWVTVLAIYGIYKDYDKPYAYYIALWLFLFNLLYGGLAIINMIMFYNSTKQLSARYIQDEPAITQGIDSLTDIAGDTMSGMFNKYSPISAKTLKKGALGLGTAGLLAGAAYGANKMFNNPGPPVQQPAPGGAPMMGQAPPSPYTQNSMFNFGSQQPPPQSSWGYPQQQQQSYNPISNMAGMAGMAGMMPGMAGMMGKGMAGMMGKGIGRMMGNMGRRGY